MESMRCVPKNESSDEDESVRGEIVCSLVLVFPMRMN